MKIAIALGTVAVALGLAASASAQVNGSFANGLTGWNVLGDVVVVHIPPPNPQPVPPVPDNKYYVRLEESPGDDQLTPLGGRSRIYQVFTLPAGAAELRFSYRLVRGPYPRPSTVPPDSFTAFLLNEGKTRDGHLVFEGSPIRRLRVGGAAQRASGRRARSLRQANRAEEGGNVVTVPNGTAGGSAIRDCP